MPSFLFRPLNSLDSGVELCLEIDMSTESSPDFFLFYTSPHAPLYCLCCCFSLPSPCPLQPEPFFSPSLTFSSSSCRLFLPLHLFVHISLSIVVRLFLSYSAAPSALKYQSIMDSRWIVRLESLCTVWEVAAPPAAPPQVEPCSQAG